MQAKIIMYWRIGHRDIYQSQHEELIDQQAASHTRSVDDSAIDKRTEKRAESPIIMLFMLQESYKQAYFMANGATTLQTSTWKGRLIK